MCDLKASLQQLRVVGKTALKSYNKEANIHIKWANSVAKAVKKGTLDTHLLVKTSQLIKSETVLQPVIENDSSPTNIDVQSCSSRTPKQKGQSDEHIEAKSKRICASITASNDGGASTEWQKMCNSTPTVTIKERNTSKNGHLETVKDEPEPVSPQIYVSPNFLNGSGTRKEQEARQAQGLHLSQSQTNVTNEPSKEKSKGTPTRHFLRTPVRVTMAKTRSLVNGAPEPGKVSSKDEDTASETVLTQLVHSSNRTRETPLSSNFNRLKPIASTSRIPVPILKATFPSDNCIGPLTPSFQRSNSFTVSKSFNLITASRAVHQPINKEDSKTNFKSKIEAAIKKKEEIMNAQMEEKKRMREAKWLKVRAQREAKERGNLEKLIKKEARQKQIQAEREEKIREDNLKKKLLAEKKAAEFEERRRQEKAKLAKIKQQLEEEAEQTADLSQLDQEYAQRKLKGMAQEIEAAAYRVKETEIHSKQASSKSQADLTFTSEPQKNHQTKTNANNHCIADDGPDDSSDEEKPKKPVPLWAQTSHRLPKLLEDQYITQFQVYLFFGSGKTTPDLSKIFSEIDRRMLLRKSSAVWCTPPKVKG